MIKIPFSLAPYITLLPRFFRSYHGLLFTLVFIFFQPLFASLFFSRLIYNIALSMAFVVGMTSIYAESRYRLLAIVLAVLAIVFRWLEHHYQGVGSIILSGSLAAALFFIYTSATTLRHIIKARVITEETISAAISLYLMIGLIFALFYTTLHTLNPLSFSLPEMDKTLSEDGDARTFLYFSFVTLTTVGFGDTLPTGELARSLTILEAIIGQMFIAVLIGSLVGKKSSS